MADITITRRVREDFNLNFSFILAHQTYSQTFGTYMMVHILCIYIFELYYLNQYKVLFVVQYRNTDTHCFAILVITMGSDLRAGH